MPEPAVEAALRHVDAHVGRRGRRSPTSCGSRASPPRASPRRRCAARPRRPAELLRRAGLESVRLLEMPGHHPYVYGEWLHAEGAPTLLVYGAPRRAAPGARREVDDRPLRARRARRAPLRPGDGGRQGHLRHPRGRDPGLARDRGPPAGQRQGPHRGRGGDRLARPRAVPRAPPAAARRRRRRPRRHRQLRRRPPRAHVPAARHLPGGRGGALPAAAGPQRLLGRAGARRRAHPRSPRRRPREARRLAERARPLPPGGEDARPAAPPHPRPPLRREEVPRLGGDEAGHAPRRARRPTRCGSGSGRGPR